MAIPNTSITPVHENAGGAPGQSQASGRAWLLLTAILVLLVSGAAVVWILDHPYGTSWDETLYLNGALRDLHNLHSGHLRQLGSILIGGDVRRPPANLLVALPFLVVFGFHTSATRLVTLACYLVSAWFIYLTTRRFSSRAAGALAVLVFCLSPEVIAVSTFFSTEGPFFVATAAMLYFASFYLDSATAAQLSWMGLGFAIGVGLLSKSSFVLIALPVLLVTFLLSYRRQAAFLITSFLKAGAVAFVIAAPWYVKNLGPALDYAKFAREQPRNSLGAPSLVIWAKWLLTVAISLIGPALSILIAVVAIVAIRQMLANRDIKVTPGQRALLVTCACAILPTVFLQLSGTNHLLRYVCPVLIPFAISAGVFADALGWIRSSAALALSGTLGFAQLLMIAAPVIVPNKQPVDPGFANGGLPWRVLTRVEQWDWKPLRQVAQNCGLEKPKIAFLGMGRPLNPPQLLYPWFLAGMSPSDRDGFVEPVWLWRYEQGPLDWKHVMGLAQQSDLVITAPNFTGEVTDKENFDNQFNGEFSKRLAADAAFRGPVHLQMGRFEPIDVTVFLNEALVCSSTPQQQAKQ